MRRVIVDASSTGTADEAVATIGAGMLRLAADWTPDALAALLRQALELAALEGREAVFAEAEGAARFAEPDFTRQEFREQIDFLTQKRPAPSRVWTDFMQGQHDRSFVVAGVTDQAMIDEFHTAMVEAARTVDIRGFAAEFDRLVDRYGWSYNGGREWRIRTIFDTNIRTSYMAGRLKQMRDPDMVRLRPFWMYRHADTRVPKEPRLRHLAWDGLVLRWDDPWWDVYFPPNDWRCSCGVHSLSRGDLKRMGKSGPDEAPEIVRRPYTHEASGETVMLPEGTGYGWDYMPGDHWERGLVPSALLAEAQASPRRRHLAIVDEPRPLADLVDRARPFVASLMEPGLPDSDYMRAFLNPLGADIGRANLFIDRTGTRIPISELMLMDRNGAFKLRKRGRELYMARLAETILDPDEIWIGVTEVPVPGMPGATELVVDRRYIRVDRESGMIAVFQIGRHWWDQITVYPTSDSRGRPDLSLLDLRRGGKLLWSRLGKSGRSG